MIEVQKIFIRPNDNCTPDTYGVACTIAHQLQELAHFLSWTNIHPIDIGNKFNAIFKKRNFQLEFQDVSEFDRSCVNASQTEVTIRPATSEWHSAAIVHMNFFRHKHKLYYEIEFTFDGNSQEIIHSHIKKRGVMREIKSMINRDSSKAI